MKFTYTMKGIDETIRNKLRDPKVQEELDRVIMTTMQNFAQQAASRAPVDTGRLRNSLLAYTYRHALLDWRTLEGTDYTMIQEYEHKSKSGFVRNSFTEQFMQMEKDLQHWVREKRKL